MWRTNMIPEIMAAIILALLPLYVALRLCSHKLGRDDSIEITPSKQGKIHYSKVYDTAFFDGIEEDYAEAMNRMKQIGR